MELISTPPLSACRRKESIRIQTEGNEKHRCNAAALPFNASLLLAMCVYSITSPARVNIVGRNARPVALDIDGEGKAIIRRKLKRRYVLLFFKKLQPCIVGIEAWASSHHWSREIQALGAHGAPDAFGLREALRQEPGDAKAICDAFTAANMRFVETKTREQQSYLMLHRRANLSPASRPR